MPQGKVETRRLQIRAAQGEEFVLTGRALSYNEISSSELYPEMRERLMPGCFRASLAGGNDVVALYNHLDSALPLGRLKSGTLSIKDSDAGLDFRVQLDKDNSQHRDLYAAVKRQDLSEMSFAFIAQDQSFTDETYNGQPCKVRNIRKAVLGDLSIVVTPFYGDGATSVAARNAAAAQDEDLARRARLAQLDDDYNRRSKAHELGLRLLAETFGHETRGNQEWFADRCREACSAMGADYCSHDASQSALCGDIYAGDPDDEDEDRCFKYRYQTGADGVPVVDTTSKTAVRHTRGHAAGELKRARKADQELRFKMDVAAGRR